MKNPYEPAADAATSLPAQLDFVHAVGNCLLVYGWVAGLFSDIASARLQAGAWRCELLTDALSVARPDVSLHLASMNLPVPGDDHGFFVLSEMTDPIAQGSMLRMTLTTLHGELVQREWPIAFGNDAAALTLRKHERAMRLLIPRQSPRQVNLLTRLFRPPLAMRAGDLNEAATPFGPPMHVPISCLIGDSTLVIAGTLPVAIADFEHLELRWGTLQASLLDTLTVLPNPTPLHDAGDLAATLASKPNAFLAVSSLPATVSAAGSDLDIVHRAHASVGTMRLTLRSHPQDVQSRLASWLGGLEPANRIAACEALLAELPIEERLRHWRETLILLVEGTIPHLAPLLEGKDEWANLRMFPERVVPVPHAGVLIEGWAHSDPGEPIDVVYCSSGEEYPVSLQWVRRPRADVRTHLAETGLGHVDEPGFCCLVMLPNPPRPAYLKVRAGDQVWRLRLSLPSSVEPTRRLIRSILSMMDASCSELRRLLDQHLGPAVEATWKARPGPHGSAQVLKFGPAVAEPTVSIVVPLFGRHDFADYQLALFTDDPDLHRAELIYVVDDPNMINDFRRQCPDLYATHGLPFTLAYPGDNLGFAGATNFGASLAQAPLLLLLNSDVLPRHPGWLGTLCDDYRAHPDTGLMGVKLLYEDGTIQHAGITSEPYAAWQGLWINRHPHKGLDPTPLTGIVDSPAVTAACTLVETALYRRLGGLSEDFLIGDFEDTDLCYRARQLGRPCRVDLDVTLYHLERQSQDLGDQNWRTALTLYNCWIHDVRWGKLLEAGHL